ncbi:bifunctional nicotinamidase/pyrazinamidase [Litoribacter ruber]|uniref:bifunctional nicotinamidase/pyrazinamidase n=1 Tax=Litoribacter ruber TaxID=702568 RepID=UPI001BDAB0C0|nr:bifunctional nicotinamidase/pyrazinamidase [Litoribacter ruber]MBT0811722.1 bifunctional nicotinamidase/pyrazinamidase [Litoribacter ruber]
MKALIIVDVQYDFLPGGALAVKEGDKIIPVINSLQPKFDLVVATQDWHPADHGSFASNHPGKKVGDFIKLGGVDQILWPEHCVQESPGAEFHTDLDNSYWAKVFRKGMDQNLDSYSGFYDNNRKQDTGLAAYLKGRGVDEVVVVGLAADYCVKFTVLDAIHEGFKTTLIKDATKAVNIQEDDFDKALYEMQQAGAQIILSDNF